MTKRKILVGYDKETKWTPDYELHDIGDGGYSCGCGADDHDDFDDEHGCECYCHK